MKDIRRWVFVAMVFALWMGMPVSEARADTVVIRTSGGFGRDEIGTSKRFGIGIDGGWPFSGINFKFYASQGSAIQLTVGGFRYYGLGVKAQYLLHPAVLLQGPGVTIPFYVGGGIGMGADPDGIALDLHIPLGLAFQLRFLPLDFFLQAEPGFGIGLGYVYRGFLWGGGGGARWYF